MNKKGFTLIETLAVVIILGLISALALPKIGDMLLNSRYEKEEAEAEFIYDLTKDYVSTKLAPGVLYGEECFKLSDLVKDGYLSSKDASSNSFYKKNNSSYIDVEIYNGDYGFHFVEEDNPYYQNYCSSSSGLIKLKGNKEMTIDVNSEYNEPGFDIYGKYSIIFNPSWTVEVTSCPEYRTYCTDVKTYNSSSNKITDIKLDTSEPAKYVLTYTNTYLSNNSVAERTVTVKDISAPIIIVTPQDIKIPYDTTEFNAYDYALISDNYDENPKITIKTNLTLGIPGTYTITYTAVDEAGNKATATKKVTVMGPGYGEEEAVETSDTETSDIETSDYDDPDDIETYDYETLD